MASGPPASGSEIATPLRIVFMGTPALAAHILERLADACGDATRPGFQSSGFEIAGVVTRPDQPRGRGLRLEPSEVGAVAERRGLPVLKPAKIRTAEFLAELSALNPDLLVVAAYGRILPDPVLAAARIMPINVHASLLPRHRGASPVEGAILAGDDRKRRHDHARDQQDGCGADPARSRDSDRARRNPGHAQREARGIGRGGAARSVGEAPARATRRDGRRTRASQPTPRP